VVATAGIDAVKSISEVFTPGDTKNAMWVLLLGEDKDYTDLFSIL
jgi:hypothetical protein